MLANQIVLVQSDLGQQRQQKLDEAKPLRFVLTEDESLARRWTAAHDNPKHRPHVHQSLQRRLCPHYTCQQVHRRDIFSDV